MATASEKSRKSSSSFRGLTASKKASAAIRKAISRGDAKALQAAWLDELARPLKHIHKALGQSPLLAMWSVETVELSSRERELAVSLNDLSSDRPRSHAENGKTARKSTRPASPFEEILSSWLADGNGTLGTWETLVLAEILLREGAQLSADCFVRVLSQIACSQTEENPGGLFESITGSPENADPLQLLISSAEVPWISGLILSPILAVSERLDEGRSQLEKTLTESSDTDGLVHGSLLKRLPEWLAPLTRCTLWSNLFQRELWSDEACVRLAAVTERCAMMIVPIQLHHVESDAPAEAKLTLREVLDVLVPVSGSQWDHQLLKLMKACDEPASEEVRRPKKLKKPKDEEAEASEESAETSDRKKKKNRKEKDKDKKEVDEKPELVVSWESDASNIAILRTTAEADADVATLEWHSSTPELTLTAAGVTVFSGAWTWALSIDDQPVDLPTSWKCSCWFLDPETVFVELEGEGSDTIKRVRQLLLAPQDRFAMITETVTCGDPTKKIQLTTTLPLVDGGTAAPDSITRELVLSASQRKIRTIPVWMDDDRILNSPGGCRVADGRLELSAIGQGGVTMPLALDWHPKRTDAPADWARLTVTEARRVLGSHEASGHRVRIGNHQVLIYRSLQSGQNSRAVLGVHTWDESVYSRVPPIGKLIQALVEVEAPE